MPVTINSLATETLSEIFLHTFRSQSNEDWCARTLPNPLPVSHRWQSTIKLYAELWTHVFISEQSAHSPGQSLFQSTHSRLFRSGNRPLDITIKFIIDISPNNFDIHEAETLGKIINAVASRLQHFEISGHHFSLERAVLREMGGTTMPILRSFIHSGSQDPEDVFHSAEQS